MKDTVLQSDNQGLLLLGMHPEGVACRVCNRTGEQILPCVCHASTRCPAHRTIICDHCGGTGVEPCEYCGEESGILVTNGGLYCATCAEEQA